jgi:exodeoxyribonuclease V alpha subunit
VVKEGYVEKVIYKNDENGYAVFTVEGEDGEDIFVGTLHGISEGIYISAEGEYITHPQYDLQFKFTSYEIKLPEDIVSVERYLSSGIIKGVGEALAKRIVKKFKMDSLRIIEEEPERLAEIKGISERKAREIAISYNEKKEMQDAIIFLTGYGISVNLAVKIYNEYGEDMYNIVRTNPYKIAEDITGIGFKTADEMAERIGIKRDSDFRIRAALLYTLLNANRLGHMYLPKDMLVAKTYSLLTEDYMPYDEELAKSVEEQIIELQMAGKVVVKDILSETYADDMSETSENGVKDKVTAVYASTNYYVELNSARILSDLNVNLSSKKTDVDDMLDSIEKSEKIILDERQREAIKSAVNSGVAVITGGPGTGKTTTINAMIMVFENMKLNIMLGAPTGRAAKRITEATGYTAQTIHRMLELSGGGIEDEEVSYRFARNSNNPLETDVIIIDEMSMVDSSLFYSLLQAVMPGTRLILVGDSNQLPSVGPGNVLKDIIKSEVFSVTTLDKIFRQGEGSDIITNAHKINAGQQLEINNKSKDFFYIPRNNPQDIIAELKQLITKNLPGFFDVDVMNIQVLTPMRKYELGVENLNKRLQEILNPARANVPEKEKNDVIFRKNDKVMQIKNNYKMEWKIMDDKNRFVKEEGVGVFNGDVGIVKEVDDFDQKLVVEFDDGRVVDYMYSQLDELEHAYAITIHKSQGSEYPVVIIPLLSGPPKLLNRNLLYTAVTRAKKGVVLVGNINLVKTMIDNIDEQKRYTTFAERLKELA